MKEISWTELKRKTLAEIREGRCLKVTGDGEMAFYVAVNPQQIMRIRVEAICGMIDAGKSFKEE